MALVAALDAAPPVGLRDMAPAYASLLVHFDPLLTSADAIEHELRRTLASLSALRAPRGRLVRIPVHYGGADGPDLDEVAALVGLPAAEVARRHAAAAYRVYFLGFLAGFPYLGGLPRELAAPRLSSPRPRVPAGSVGIAGQQTGIYPVASPGGWRIIGRTPLRLFDPARDPPALLRPGDRVRFAPLPPQTPLPAAEGHDDTTAYPHAAHAVAAGAPCLVVNRPGPLTTVQDLGRLGYARYGVSASGAADADALRLGNALLGNPAGATGLEIPLGGAELEVLAPAAVTLTGADSAAHLNGRPLRHGTVVALAAGDRLALDPPRRGARTYLCVAGGLAVPPVLGSRSTDLRAGLGGLDGRALRAGDILGCGPPSQPPDALAGRRLPADPVRDAPAQGIPAVRVLPGPHARACPADLAALLASAFTVDPRSDRVGVRLRPTDEGTAPQLVGGETLSEGMPRGAVQVPPGGEPIVLLADHQTTGGYRVPAVVIAADLWRIAQLRAGDGVRFELTSHEGAVAVLRARHAWLDDMAATISATRAPSASLLMRGFAEWSEEDLEDD